MSKRNSTAKATEGRLNRLVMLDDDGVPVRRGDKVSFSYGIPPVFVVADVVQRCKRLAILTPGHNPEASWLSDLRRHVGGWHKHNAPHQP